MNEGKKQYFDIKVDTKKVHNALYDSQIEPAQAGRISGRPVLVFLLIVSSRLRQPCREALFGIG